MACLPLPVVDYRHVFLCKSHILFIILSPQKLVEAPDQGHPERKINGCLFLLLKDPLIFFCIEIRNRCLYERVIALWYISPKFLLACPVPFSLHCKSHSGFHYTMWPLQVFPSSLFAQLHVILQCWATHCNHTSRF